MPIADYTTIIDVPQTLREIQTLLATHNAKRITLNQNGGIDTLSFDLSTPYGEIAIKLPVNKYAVKQALVNDGLPPRYCTSSHAEKVAWRITRDWLRSQLAYVDTDMVRVEQVFLPYMLINNERTLLDTVEDKQFRLTAGVL